MKKKRSWLLVLMVCIICAFMSISASAASPKLNATKAEIALGTKLKLKLSSAKASAITWSTSNKKVATVAKNGVVTGKAYGKVTITAKYKKKNYKCAIKVLPATRRFLLRSRLLI